MSQNFSNKSDIFIPELMELDSYWQKAVEDAISDTLKGEKRLHYALRNRKKINQKLEKLGLKPIPSQLSFLKSVPQGTESKEKLGSYSEEENQDMNSESSRNDDAHSQKKQRSLDRPTFTARSLEKLKKSQNSFNCEPMGVAGSNDDLSESNPEDNENFGERNKKIRWLHVRDDGDFDDSDSEPEVAYRRNEKTKNGSPRRRNFATNTLRLPHSAGHGPDDELGEATNCKRKSGPRRRMRPSTTKKDALDGSSNGSSSLEIKAEAEPEDEIPEKRKKDKQKTPPFIRFYLEVYRELGHKYSAKHITKEAARRWGGMSAKQKSRYSY